MSGAAEFTGLSLTAAANDYRIEADVNGLTPAISSDFQIAAGAATHLAITAAPPSVLAAGQSFGVAVAALDQFGNVVPTVTAPVTVSLASGPNGALSGETNSILSAGVVRFSGLALDSTGSSFALQVASPGLTPGFAGAISVVPAAPARILIVASPPSSVAAGAPFGVTVEAEDSFGNLATSFDGPISVGLAGNPTGGTLAGSLSANFHGGIVSFSDLVVDRAGAGYSLVATAGPLATGPSAEFSVSPGTAASAVIASGPPAHAQVGRHFGLTLELVDQFGNRVTAFDGMVTTALASNKARAKLAGTLSVSASWGVATFTDLVLKKTGKGFTLAVTPSGLPSLTTTAFNVTKTPPKRALHAFARPSLPRRLRP